jgi:hypothetical protein
MKEFYDEVERIGNRVGTVRSVEGIYNVSLGLPLTTNKKANIPKDKPAKPISQPLEVQ